MNRAKLLLTLILLTCLAAPAFAGSGDAPWKSRTRVEEKCVGVLMEQFGVELKQLSEDTRLREDLGADNTDLIELMMALEDAFDVTISDAQWADVTTIESAVDVIFEIENSSRW